MLEGFRYSWKAELFQWPKSFICESGMPCAAAVVAAPFLKLWPAKLPASIPSSDKAFLSSITSLARVRSTPDCSRNKSPGALPLYTSYVRRVATGHNSSSVHGILIIEPSLKGSVFDAIKQIWITLGVRMLSTVILSTSSSAEGSDPRGWIDL